MGLLIPYSFSVGFKRKRMRLYTPKAAILSTTVSNIVSIPLKSTKITFKKFLPLAKMYAFMQYNANTSYVMGSDHTFHAISDSIVPKPNATYATRYIIPLPAKLIKHGSR